MTRILTAAALVVFATGAHAQGYGYGQNNGFGTGSNSNSHYNSGHTTRSGTIVQPHYSTNPNTTQNDNFGARGNSNPYTGATGTRSPRY